MIDKNKVEFFLFRTAQKIFGSIGLNITRRIAVLAGTLFFYLVPIRKRTTIENISKAFPDKSVREIKNLARKNYQNVAVTFLELMCLPSLTKEQMKEQVEFDKPELLDKLIDEPSGLIIFNGHFGNWEFLMSGIAVNIKKHLNVLMRPQRNSYLNEWLKEARAHFGTRVIEAGVSVKDLYKALVNKEAVGIAGDQRGHFDNPRFNFFNRPTALYTGTASIALRTKSNILLTMLVRQKNFKFKCCLEQLSFENLSENEESKINEITQRYISFIEKYVRLYPEQYFWMHKLWKY